MARSQKEMKLRNSRPAVDTQAALALAKARASSKVVRGQPSSPKRKIAEQRPDLRVVERTRRKIGFRISHKMLVFYAIGFLALFAAVVMRAEMAATQLRLNALNSKLTSLETQHLSMEVELSSLQSPSRVVSYAENHLGMVYPAKVGYLGATQKPAVTPPQSTALTPQVISAPNTLFAPPGEAGGGAPTRPLPKLPATANSSGSASAPGSGNHGSTSTTQAKKGSAKKAGSSASSSSRSAKSG